MTVGEKEDVDEEFPRAPPSSPLPGGPMSSGGEGEGMAGGGGEGMAGGGGEGGIGEGGGGGTRGAGLEEPNAEVRLDPSSQVAAVPEEEMVLKEAAEEDLPTEKVDDGRAQDEREDEDEEEEEQVRRGLVVRVLGKLVSGLLVRRSVGDKGNTNEDRKEKGEVGIRQDVTDDNTRRLLSGQRRPTLAVADGDKAMEKKTEDAVQASSKRNERFKEPERERGERMNASDEEESEGGQHMGGRRRAVVDTASTTDGLSNRVATRSLRRTLLQEESVKTDEAMHDSEDSRAGSVGTETVDMENLENVDLNRLTYRQLRKACKHLGVSASGKKVALLHRLRSALRKTHKAEHEQKIGVESAAAEVHDEDATSPKNATEQRRGGVLETMDEEDGISRVGTSKPEPADSRNVETSKPEQPQSPMDVSKPEPAPTREDAWPNSEKPPVQADNWKPVSATYRMNTSNTLPASRMDTSAHRTLSRVETSGPKRPLDETRPVRKREREVDSIEPIVAGDVSVTKSHDGTTSEDNNRDTQTKKLRYPSGLDFVADMSRSVKRGRRTITASEFEMYARVLFDGVRDDDRAHAINTIERLYEYATPNSKQKTDPARNSYYSSKLCTGSSAPPQTRPSQPLWMKTPSRVPDMPVSALNFSPVPGKGESRVPQVPVMTARDTSGTKHQRPALNDEEQDRTLANAKPMPAMRIEKSEERIAAKTPTVTENLREAKANTPGNIVEAFLSKSSTFLPKPFLQGKGLGSDDDGSAVFHPGSRSVVERPRQRIGASTLRRWRQRGELRHSESVAVSDLRGSLGSPSTKLAVTKTTRKIMETLEKISTPRVGLKRERSRTMDAQSLTIPATPTLPASDAQLQSKSLVFHPSGHERPKRRRMSAEKPTDEEGVAAMGRMERIRRQAKSKQETSLDEARDRLSSALKERTRTPGEKAVTWKKEDNGDSQPLTSTPAVKAQLFPNTKLTPVENLPVQKVESGRADGKPRISMESAVGEEADKFLEGSTQHAQGHRAEVETGGGDAGIDLENDKGEEGVADDEDDKSDTKEDVDDEDEVDDLPPPIKLPFATSFDTPPSGPPPIVSFNTGAFATTFTSPAKTSTAKATSGLNVQSSSQQAAPTELGNQPPTSKKKQSLEEEESATQKDIDSFRRGTEPKMATDLIPSKEMTAPAPNDAPAPVPFQAPAPADAVTSTPTVMSVPAAIEERITEKSKENAAETSAEVVAAAPATPAKFTFGIPAQSTPTEFPATGSASSGGTGAASIFGRAQASGFTFGASSAASAMTSRALQKTQGTASGPLTTGTTEAASVTPSAPTDNGSRSLLNAGAVTKTFTAGAPATSLPVGLTLTQGAMASGPLMASHSVSAAPPTRGAAGEALLGMPPKPLTAPSTTSEIAKAASGGFFGATTSNASIFSTPTAAVEPEPVSNASSSALGTETPQPFAMTAGANAASASTTTGVTTDMFGSGTTSGLTFGSAASSSGFSSGPALTALPPSTTPNPFAPSSSGMFGGSLGTNTADQLSTNAFASPPATTAANKPSLSFGASTDPATKSASVFGSCTSGVFGGLGATSAPTPAPSIVSPFGAANPSTSAAFGAPNPQSTAGFSFQAQTASGAMGSGAFGVFSGASGNVSSSGGSMVNNNMGATPTAQSTTHAAFSFMNQPAVTPTTSFGGMVASSAAAQSTAAFASAFGATNTTQGAQGPGGAPAFASGTPAFTGGAPAFGEATGTPAFGSNEPFESGAGGFAMGSSNTRGRRFLRGKRTKR